MQSLDGQWWYHQDAEFAYDYGRTNPFEDWSTIFEAAYAKSLGRDIPDVQAKLDVVDQLFQQFRDS